MFLIPFLLSFGAVNLSFGDVLTPKKPKPSPTPFQDWDYLVFSQRWPITGCSQWEERNTQNTCNLPNDNTTWTVHGLWPTKIGALGPFFCNSALHFDPDQLTPFLKDLQQFWTNVEANTKPDSFWKHEWNKHGTCASTLPQLNSVTNFFKKGLQLNQDYNLATILSKSSILPNLGGFNLTDIYNAVKVGVGKNPVVECVTDSLTKESYLSEIRICFDKNFNLIHCNVSEPEGSFRDGDILSNCNREKNVMYLATVPNNTDADELLKDVYFDDDEEPNLERCLEYFNFQGKLLKLYTVLRFLIWFTL